jgi:hypothetical protein
MLVPQVGAQLIMQRYSRDAERESDLYGMRYMQQAGYDPQGAVHLQETFVELSQDRRQDWLTGLFASHPPSMERVELNRRTASQLPPGGDLGRQRYQQKLAYLERVEPAYEAYGEAGEALEKDDLVGAQRLLDRALDLEPREALFLAMQGDIEVKRQQLGAALRSYDRAIVANDQLFYPYLRKGQVAFRLEDHRTARTSLQRSLDCCRPPRRITHWARSIVLRVTAVPPLPISRRLQSHNPRPGRKPRANWSGSTCSRTPNVTSPPPLRSISRVGYGCRSQTKPVFPCEISRSVTPGWTTRAAPGTTLCATQTP